MKKLVFILLLSSLWLFVHTPVLAAATYYVSPSGSDTALGTLASPFKTIQRAAGIVNPGDTVLIRGGTYNKTVPIARSGSSSARIIFKNYPGETPVIDGGGLGISYYSALVTVSANYVTLSGLTIQNSPAAGINMRGSNNVLDNLKITRTHARAVDFDGSSYSTLQKSEVTNNVLCNENGKRGCNNAPTWPINVGITNSHHINILDNFVHDNWGEGIASWRGSHYSVIVGNTVKDNWSVDIYLDHADYSAVEKNFIYESDASDSSARQKIANGISIADEVYSGHPCGDGRNTIRNNIIVNTRRGISFFNYQSCSGLRNTTIDHNTIVKTWEQAILINTGAHSGSFIRNNILYPRNSSSTSSFTGISASQNLSQNPLLVNKDASLSSANVQNYKLSVNSPAINTGTLTGTTTDFFGTSRDTRPDIGAHEAATNSVPYATPTPGPSMSADINADGKVNALDFVILFTQFGKHPPTDPRADITRDGLVNSLDYVILFEQYGSGG